MSRQHAIIGLILTMLLQLALLGWILGSAMMPLWTGTEIRVKTIPVDPRSLFRGNYARLAYEFSTLPKDALDVGALRENEPVYVSLQADSDQLYSFAGVSTTKPKDGIFLRGRINGKHLSRIRSGNARSGQVRSGQVRYGIEAWFAPKEKALQLETDLRDGGVAVLMVTDNGKAALTDILPLD